MAVIAALRRVLLVSFEAVALAAFVVMLVSSVLQVIFRYLLNLPLMWTEELARMMCVLTTYFGAVVVLLLREHIRVDLIDTMVGPRGRAIAVVVGDVLVGWFLVAFGYGCWLMANATWQTETATMAWFRMGYVYAAVGVSAAAMLVVVIFDIAEGLFRLMRPANEATG
jgi:TRAP-type C4-dicarboxylate transport system permease small subunit